MSLAIGFGNLGGGGGGSFGTLTGVPGDNASLQAALDAELNVLQPEGTIASAATTDLASVSSEQISITGTTTITSLGNGAAGTRKFVRFGGILQLTYNATSLILPGTTNITTAVNDRAAFLSLGGGNWICLWYQRANGQLVIPQVNAGQTQDVTAITYNVDGSIATYTVNGYTWTMAYNANGTPNTETSGTLVKTYNYNGGGQFTGISGAINAGMTKIVTIATLPTAANSAPGDIVFVTDIANRELLTVAQGNKGQAFQFVGATGTGYWAPVGAFDVDKKLGSIATPVASLAGAIAASTVFGSSLAIPGGVLKAGMHLRAELLMRRTGSTTSCAFLSKVGQLNSASDTTARLVGGVTANNTMVRLDMDIFITSSTTAQISTSTVSNQSGGDADGNQVSLTGLNLANPLYINGGTNSLPAGDTLQLVNATVRLLA